MAVSFWHCLPIIGFLVSEWQVWREEQTRPRYGLAALPPNRSQLPPYPIDMWPLLAVPYGMLDEAGVPFSVATRRYPAGYYATPIAQYGLAQWNAYLATGEEKHRQAFLIQADWLVTHEVRLADGAGGWPFTIPLYDYYTPVPWLSALVQGNGISVLVRAYRLTGQEVFLHLARRAVHTFELDIAEGGVSASIGQHGVFFEEVAVHPAAQILNGYLFALFGLYDYVALTADAHIATLIERSLLTLHTLLDEFDLGYWSSYDLLYRQPAPLFYHDQHSTLLQALASYSGCEHCRRMAARWTSYQHSFSCRLRYFLVSRFIRYRRGLRRVGLGRAVLRVFKVPDPAASSSVRVGLSGPAGTPLGALEKEGTR